ncbi:LutC/YkgG family protein [Flavitalea flava]
MSSRDKILGAVIKSQPAFIDLPETAVSREGNEDLVKKFITVLESIGGTAYVVTGFEKISAIIQEKFADAQRIVSSCHQLSGISFGSKGAVIESGKQVDDPHSLEDIDLAILRAHFGVAENSACWITEDLMIERVMPFICQHLALIIKKKDIVPTMNEAYIRVAAIESSAAAYGFSTFIAGPSKTADIEQSLVLGAHGPKTMIVFIMDQEGADAGFY